LEGTPYRYINRIPQDWKYEIASIQSLRSMPLKDDIIKYLYENLEFLTIDYNLVSPGNIMPYRITISLEDIEVIRKLLEDKFTNSLVYAKNHANEPVSLAGESRLEELREKVSSAYSGKYVRFKDNLKPINLLEDVDIKPLSEGIPDTLILDIIAILETDLNNFLFEEYIYSFNTNKYSPQTVTE
jgi:hypothetical protein